MGDVSSQVINQHYFKNNKFWFSFKRFLKGLHNAVFLFVYHADANGCFEHHEHPAIEAGSVYQGI